jgi:hypothetical protein
MGPHGRLCCLALIVELWLCGAVAGADPPEGYIPVSGNVIATLFVHRSTKEKIRYPRLGTFEVRCRCPLRLLLLLPALLLLLLLLLAEWVRVVGGCRGKCHLGGCVACAHVRVLLPATAIPWM